MKYPAQFSDKAIGIISNHGDHHFYEFQLEHLFELGLKHFIYLGPLGVLGDEAGRLIHLMTSVPIKWVYGKHDTYENGSISEELPAGDNELLWHGILFRYFLQSNRGESWRLWDLTFSHPGFYAVELLASLAQVSQATIIVIGSGVHFEHWIWHGSTITLREKDGLKGLVEGPVVLEKDYKHIIVHPSSRSHRCSVIDPQHNRIVIYPW